jgi:hypothetical protein
VPSASRVTMGRCWFTRGTRHSTPTRS